MMEEMGLLSSLYVSSNKSFPMLSDFLEILLSEINSMFTMSSEGWYSESTAVPIQNWSAT